MTAIKPCENRRVRSIAAERYPLNAVSAHPESTEPAVDPHHIFPRSAIGGDSWFVEITDDDAPSVMLPGQTYGQVIPHVVGLSRDEHERVERHDAWIKYEDGEFVWYDRVAQADPQDELPEDWQEWVCVGPLNPQPGQQGKPKRKRLKGDARAKRKTISFRVPDDAERGSEVFDTLLAECKEEMVTRGLKDDPDEITTYIALTGVMASWLQS